MLWALLLAPAGVNIECRLRQADARAMTETSLSWTPSLTGIGSRELLILLIRAMLSPGLDCDVSSIPA
jgi:hypothetical protein